MVEEEGVAPPPPEDPPAGSCFYFDIYGAEPDNINDVIMLCPIDKLEERQEEYPSIEIELENGKKVRVAKKSNEKID